MKTRNALAALALAACLLLQPPPAGSCGPDFPIAVFSYSLHPDFPLERFARGELGILQPTYARSYLYVAYRHMSGLAFSAEEEERLTKLWQDRLTTGWRSSDELGEAKAQWAQVREKVVKAASQPQRTDREKSSTEPGTWVFYSYANCLSDAFRTAAQTLEQRIREYGVRNDEVLSWVDAQDRVFRNCGSPSESGTALFPEPAPASSPAWVRADRAYQRAAAYFYAGEFDAARKLFEEIAADKSSPWSRKAPYLVARCWLRKATVGTSDAGSSREALVQAEAQLQKILSDPTLKETHEATRRLLNLVALRIRPEEQRQALARSLLQQRPSRTLAQALVDYLVAVDRLVGEEVGQFYGEAKYQRLTARWEELKPGRPKDDLTDWILTFQAQSPEATDHSLERYEETKATPWLVAAISKVPAEHSQVPALLAAAEKLQPTSPAYPTVAFHRLRLLAETGRTDIARQELDTLLNNKHLNLPPSARNLFLALRMKVAGSFEELLAFAVRSPAMIGSNFDGLELPDQVLEQRFPGWKFEKKGPRDDRLFGADAARVLTERTPLTLLAQATQSQHLPVVLRREVATAAWVRAVLLDEPAAGIKLARELQELAPEMKPLMEAYIAAENEDARRFAGVYVVLKFPGLRPYIRAGTLREKALNQIDSYRDNWWCVLQPRPEDPLWADWYGRSALMSSPLRVLYPNREVGFPVFLSEAERSAAIAEWRKLVSLPAAPSYLAAHAIEWARRNAEDPRAPEALHLAVRSSRYGCSDADTGKHSKAAFTLLHRKYPNSSWTNRTPFWFQ